MGSIVILDNIGRYRVMEEDMSSNRKIIFNYLKKYSITAQASMGLSTQYLSEKLDIQRANVSRILNQL